MITDQAQAAQRGFAVGRSERLFLAQFATCYSKQAEVVSMMISELSGGIRCQDFNRTDFTGEVEAATGRTFTVGCRRNIQVTWGAMLRTKAGPKPWIESLIILTDRWPPSLLSCAAFRALPRTPCEVWGYGAISRKDCQTIKRLPAWSCLAGNGRLRATSRQCFVCIPQSGLQPSRSPVLRKVIRMLSDRTALAFMRVRRRVRHSPKAFNQEIVFAHNCP